MAVAANWKPSLRRADSVLYQLESAGRHMNEFSRQIRENPSSLISSRPPAEAREMKDENACPVPCSFVVLLFAACGSAPPAPVDRFYRLQADGTAAALLPFEVRSVRADSLYAERPIVFSPADDPRQLRQYHYHLWFYPPAQAVKEHMLASMDGAARGGLTLEARIVAFERVLDGGNGRAVVALDVSLGGEKGVLLQKRYRREQPAGDDSFSAFAAATEKALQAGDLRRTSTGYRQP